MLYQFELEPLELDAVWREPEQQGIEVIDDERVPLLPLVPETTTDALQLFLRDAGRHPLLTAAQEVELTRRIERGDEQAKRTMIESNLRLVISIAKKYRHQGPPLPRPDPGGDARADPRGRSSTGGEAQVLHATWWIGQAVVRGLADKARTIRMPVHIPERMQTLNRAERMLWTELGHEPTLEEVTGRAGLPLRQALEVEAAARASTSLDQPLGEQGDALFGDMVASEGPLPEERVEDTLRNEALGEALALLDDREQTVLVLRFGRLSESEPKTLDEIGRRLGYRASA